MPDSATKSQFGVPNLRLNHGNRSTFSTKPTHPTSGRLRQGPRALSRPSGRIRGEEMTDLRLSRAAASLPRHASSVVRAGGASKAVKFNLRLKTASHVVFFVLRGWKNFAKAADLLLTKGRRLMWASGFQFWFPFKYSRASLNGRSQPIGRTRSRTHVLED